MVVVSLLPQAESILKILKVQKLKGLEPGPEPTPPDVENVDEKPSEGYFKKIIS